VKELCDTEWTEDQVSENELGKAIKEAHYVACMVDLPARLVYIAQIPFHWN